MRLPVTPQVSTKNGTSNKNARLTNCLKEAKASGDKAVVRPGLVLDATASGVGHGLVVFNNNLVSVYGTTLGFNTLAGSGSLSVITDTIDADDLITACRYMSGTQWLIGGINTTTEEGNLYVYDTSDDSTTLVSTGVAIYDIKAIASNGSSVVVASRDETFGAGSPSLQVSSVSSISFTECTPTGIDPFSVKYGGGRYVAISSAVDTGCYVHWSTDDGVTWNSYLLAYERGRDILYDGTAWWIYGWDDARASYTWCYKTIDFVTFTEQTLSGLGATETVTSCAYANGTYYMMASTLLSASNGKDWTTISATGIKVKEANDGEAYIGKTTDVLYRIDGTSLTSIASTSFTGTYQDTDALSDSSIIVGATGGPRIVRIGVSGNTIPALATITGDYYDFAQSPI